MRLPRIRALTSDWICVALFAFVAGIILFGARVSLSFGYAGRYLAIVPVLALATMVYRYWRPAPRLADLTSITLKIFLILILGILISFGAATLGGEFPYRDLWLSSADAALGFDWNAYVAFVARHPTVAAALALAYGSMRIQFFVVGVILALSGQRERMQRYALAVGLTLAVTLLIFVFMPARAHGGGTWVEALDYMRANGGHAISFDNLNGIVTFPSYHTQSACLFVWACWRTAYLRWPVLGLNLALVGATPVNGVHYAVDVLAGVVIAAAVVILLSRQSSLRAFLSTTPLGQKSSA